MSFPKFLRSAGSPPGRVSPSSWLTRAIGNWSRCFLGSSIPPMYSAASADIKRVTTINGVNQNRGVCMTVRADGSVFLLIVSRPAFVRAEFLGLSVNAKVRRGSLSICPRRWRPVRSATGRIAGSLIRKG